MAAENLLQLELHVRPAQQGAFLFGLHGAEQIHVAVRAEVIAQSGAEQFEPGNPALAAELPDGIGVELELHRSGNFPRNLAWLQAYSPLALAVSRRKLSIVFAAAVSESGSGRISADK